MLYDKRSRGKTKPVVLWLMQATRVLYHNNATQQVLEVVASLLHQVLLCLDTYARTRKHTETHTQGELAVRGEFLDEIIFFARCFTRRIPFLSLSLSLLSIQIEADLRFRDNGEKPIPPSSRLNFLKIPIPGTNASFQRQKRQRLKKVKKGF